MNLESNDGKPDYSAAAAAAAATTSTTKTTNSFVCSSCGLSVDYDYYDYKVPFNSSVKLKEKCFIRKDPFSPAGKKLFLILGSVCTCCSASICVDASCSVFYTRRLCRACAVKRLSDFPKEARVKLRQTLSLK